MTKTLLRSALVIAISILVIGFARYGVYRVFASGPEVPEKLTEEPTITPSAPEPAAPALATSKSTTPAAKDLIANWKAYINSEHGYNVKYPRDLELEEGFDRRDFFQMTDLGLRDKALGDRVFYVRATDIGWGIFMPIIHQARLVKDSERTVLIDDVEGTQFKIEDLPKTKYISIERNNVLYEFIGEEELFDQILATFEFIELTKPKQRQLSFTRPAVEALPQEVRNWVENSLKFDMASFGNAIELDGKQYLFIASGARGSVDNHLVEITDVVIVGQEEVVVKAKFAKLPPDQPAIQVPHNPYDLVYIEATGLQARFVPTGDDEYMSIASLSGTDHLPTIVAQSRGIKVFAPVPNEMVGRKFSVSGVANVFESTVLYRLLDAEQNRLVDGFTTATALAPNFTREPVIPSAATNWGYFTFDLAVPETVVAGADLVLELYWESPKEGAEVDLIVIPLKFELR